MPYADFDFTRVLKDTIVLAVLCSDGRASLTTRGTPTSGTFTLKYDGQETAAISYDASAAAVLAALAELSNIPTGALTCSGGPLPSAVVIELGEELTGVRAADVLTIGTDSLAGGTNAAAELRPQRVDLTGYTLYFTAKYDPQADADAAAAFQLSSPSSGVVLTDAANGKATVTVTPANQSSLSVRDQFLYCDVVGISGAGARYTFASGILRLTAPATRAIT